MARKLKADHSVDVLQFDWTPHRTFEPIAKMWGGYSKLTAAIAAAREKAGEIDRSKDLTATGRAKAKSDYFRQHVAPLISYSLTEMDEAESKARTIRQRMVAPTDKADVVGFMKRRELREMLRSMKDDERVSAASLDDPDVVAAVIEQPGRVSGISEDQRSLLLDRAISARFPQEAEQLKAIDRAVENLDYHLGDAIKTARSIGVHDVDLMFGSFDLVSDDEKKRLAAIGKMSPDLPDR
jgi:hypothetical protein